MPVYCVSTLLVSNKWVKLSCLPHIPSQFPKWARDLTPNNRQVYGFPFSTCLVMLMVICCWFMYCYCTVTGDWYINSEGWGSGLFITIPADVQEEWLRTSSGMLLWCTVLSLPQEDWIFHRSVRAMVFYEIISGGGNRDSLYQVISLMRATPCKHGLNSAISMFSLSLLQ